MKEHKNSECVVKMSGVSKSFGAQVAIDDISMTIPRGVVFALLGENGAGKSTCLKTLLGLEPADRGQAEVLGMDSRTRGIDIRAAVGYFPENPALYDWMTVAEIGWFTAGFYGSGFQTEFERLAAEYELPLNQKIGKLSKGGRAKVTLALATAHQPPLLILDEPTSGLDTLVRRKFLESMVDVAASGRTVLLSSHQIPEVERVADTIAIINRGKLLVCDSLDNLKQSMERWIVTLATPEVALPDIKAEFVLHEGQQTRRQRLLVRDMTPDCLWAMRDHEGVQEVEVHTPSLEEIFVGLMKSSRVSDSKGSDDGTNEVSSTSAEVSQ
jgi:ABC-2 type transport system ATP-binding protein